MASSSGGIMGGEFLLLYGTPDSSSSVTLNDQPDRPHYHDSPQPSVDDNNTTHHQQHATSNNKDDDQWVWKIVLIIFIVLVCVAIVHGNSVSVFKVQVAILGGKKGSSIQRDLTRIAHASDTSTPPAGRIDEKKAKKYKEEKSLVIDGFGNEYIVITILVAATGRHKFPNINGAEDLKTAFEKLRSIPSRDLLAGEVLWTPQKVDYTLSEDELIQDYPQLAFSKDHGKFPG
ncbi:hypothetical protein PIB30_005156 [Stylosanthes scabra]|uniref:Uncharacterized protein n=1 Tax=Stylosanthes scabra TaxID=79078 RepID=A0ABU6R5Y5_9FABA|nr:hypothetical protein [Stylosanthes scabra]